MTGIYLHLPFCATKCPYCDFYSVSAQPARMDRYLKALLAELDMAPAGLAADTVYFGGGTPSLFGEERLAAVLSRLRERFSLAADSEITLETNPFSYPTASYARLLALGVNRLSFGVQSADDGELRLLGRRQGRRMIETALTRAREAGFRNLSADLMLGLPGQTAAGIGRSVELLAEQGVTHVSAYLLQLEEGTPFGASPPAGLPDEDGVAALYLAAVERLEAAGYRQYEISNFARPGYESRHNCKYWRGEDYYGFGAAAHSLIAGVRYAHPRDIDGYIATSGGDRFVTEAAPDPTAERILLGLRLVEGIDPEAPPFTAEEAARLRCAAEPLRQNGFLRKEDRRLALTPQGFLVSNAVIARLLAAIER